LNLEFKTSFVRDLKKVKDKKLKVRVREVIEVVEQAHSLQEIENVKKLKGSDRYYRVRIGDYRIGLAVEKDVVTFVRLLHRKDVYRYFP
jgi:mRNA interferase RelE/StbE